MRTLALRLVVLAMVLVLVAADRAFAYRPFDGTDAAVADPNEIEVELGPIQYVVDADGRSVIVPSFVVNIGLPHRLEVVAEGKNLLHRPNDRGTGGPLEDTALSLKYVVRPGSLQGRSGASVAIETGLLLPTMTRSAGSALTGIVSQRWPFATLHINGSVAVTGNEDARATSSVILEAFSQWKARPVAEILVGAQGRERDASVLGGVIWQVAERLSVDAGWRTRVSGRAARRDLRVGFTWGIPLSEHKEQAS